LFFYFISSQIPQMLQVGSGSFGTVYVNTTDPTIVFKIIDVDIDCASEAEILRKISHPNVLKLLGHSVNAKNRDVFAFPRFDIDLHRLLLKEQCSLETINIFARQILKGVVAIHKAGYMHRDIKPDNIFVNVETSKLVVGDFGWATKIVPDRNNTLEVCCIYYRPPELVLKKFKTYTEKVDVFSTGTVLYEMFNRMRLFPSEKRIVQDQKNFYLTQNTLVIDSMSETQFGGWKKMMRKEPKLRISAKSALLAFAVVKI